MTYVQAVERLGDTWQTELGDFIVQAAANHWGVVIVVHQPATYPILVFPNVVKHSDTILQLHLTGDNYDAIDPTHIAPAPPPAAQPPAPPPTSATCITSATGTIFTSTGAIQPTNETATTTTSAPANTTTVVTVTTATATTSAPANTTTVATTTTTGVVQEYNGPNEVLVSCMGCMVHDWLPRSDAKGFAAKVCRNIQLRRDPQQLNDNLHLMFRSDADTMLAIEHINNLLLSTGHILHCVRAT